MVIISCDLIEGVFCKYYEPIQGVFREYLGACSRKPLSLPSGNCIARLVVPVPAFFSPPTFLSGGGGPPETGMKISSAVIQPQPFVSFLPLQQSATWATPPQPSRANPSNNIMIDQEDVAQPVSVEQATHRFRE